MTAWHGEVRRRLGGGEPAMPAEGDWPEPPVPTAAAWRRTVEELSASLEEFVRGGARPEQKDLARRVGTLDRPLGTGVTIHEMLIGILQHDTYHSEPVALLKKAL